MSIFEIDHVVSMIETLDGVGSVELFMPQRGRTRQDWIIREIDQILDIN